jgi:shikimate kinase
MKGNIALIGFMGAGKSVVGRMLASRLHKEHVDMDSLIAERAGQTIAEIFDHLGESAFRELEERAAAEASVKDCSVISCGGGIVLNPANVERLRSKAVIVYLQAQPSALLERVARGGEIRPLLETADRATAISALLDARRAMYEQAADIVVDTTDMTIEEVVNEIIAGLSKHESAHNQK